MKNNYLNKIHDLKNKVIVITGSCGQLGSSMCDLFVKMGCKVIGVDNFSQFGAPKDDFLNNFLKHKKENFHEFYEEDYKVFFKNFEKKKTKN